MPDGRARAARRRGAPASAGLLGGQGRRAPRIRARACGDRGRDARARGRRATASRSAGATSDRRAFVIECSSGTYVRSLIADLGDAYCLELRRTRIGDFDVADARSARVLVGLSEALALPARGAAERRGRDPRAHGRAVEAPGPSRMPASGATGRTRPAARRRGAHRDRASRSPTARRAAQPSSDSAAERASTLGPRRKPPSASSRRPPLRLAPDGRHATERVGPRPRRIAVGEFDGVHLGHREVIAGNDTVLTFDPHPLAVLRPEAAPKLLTRLRRCKRGADRRARGPGARRRVVRRAGSPHQSPQEFIDHVLVQRLGATHVSRRRELPLRLTARPATPSLLRRRSAVSRRASCPRWRSTARSCPRAGSARSSRPARSRRRHAASARRSCCAARSCTAIARGRELGFPTANIVPDEALVCPAFGVYAARVGDAVAAVNVGVRPDVRRRSVAAGGGISARLRRGSLRPGADRRVHQPGSAVSSDSTRRRR